MSNQNPMADLAGKIVMNGLEIIKEEDATFKKTHLDEMVDQFQAFNSPLPLVNNSKGLDITLRIYFSLLYLPAYLISGYARNIERTYYDEEIQEMISDPKVPLASAQNAHVTLEILKRGKYLIDNRIKSRKPWHLYNNGAQKVIYEGAISPMLLAVILLGAFSYCAFY